jgi:hypothetical protein
MDAPETVFCLKHTLLASCVDTLNIKTREQLYNSYHKIIVTESKTYLQLPNNAFKPTKMTVFWYVLPKRAVRYTAGLKHLESCRDSFRNLKILTVYSLYIQEIILYVQEKCNCTVNKQIHTYNTRNNKHYHKYGHNLELYNSKPSVTGCIFYNKLTNK